MLSNHPETSYTKDCRLHLYQIDEDVMQYEPVYRPLTTGINGVENSTEEKINQPASLSRNAQTNSTGWLNRLLIGVMGASVLASAGYCCYALGRTSSTWRPSEKADLAYPENTLSVASDSGGISSVMLMQDQQVAADLARTSGVSRSPYSYYESQRKTESTTSEPGVSEAVINDNNYPLDSIFKKELANFCLSSVHELVIKSNKEKPEYRCELLREVVEKIYYYKSMYSVLRQINSEREQLVKEEKNTEIMTKRKLTTLYLAAETIISGKDTLHFYINAMKDDKNYPSEELSKREEKIINYLSAHQPVGDC